MRELFERYGLSYTTGRMPKQVASAWWKVVRLSLPNRYAALLGGRSERKALKAQRAAQAQRPATEVAAANAELAAAA